MIVLKFGLRAVAISGGYFFVLPSVYSVLMGCFSVNVGEFGRQDFAGAGFFGEGGLVGVGGVGGAEGFEHAAGVVAAAHGHAAGAGDLEDGVAALGDDLDEAFDLGGAAGELEHDGLGGEVDDAGLEDVGEFKDLRAGVLAERVRGAGGYLEEAELA